jgi:ATP-dependent protease Clp ATPase subunit
MPRGFKGIKRPRDTKELYFVADGSGGHTFSETLNVHQKNVARLPALELSLAEEALGAIARKAIERKTGARGLRSIMESILLDTMFDMPSLEGVREVVISKQVVEGTAQPLYVYADRSGHTGDASA